MNFASDNSGPVHPQVMAALEAANTGYALPYGVEPQMEQVTKRLCDVFEAPEAAVYLVATGTAANSVILSCYAQPYQTIFCSDVAHIHVDECGAPEFFTGGSKLTPVITTNGKMSANALRDAVTAVADGNVHAQRRGPVSITQVTERGTVYALDELRGLTTVARDHGLPVHMDGARFANALVALGCSPAEMTWKAGVDAVSFGGTKNGLMGVEAVILFDPALAWEFELRRKRGGHLFSKHRYLSAQMAAYLTDDLWLDMARAANAAATRLANGLRGRSDVELLHPVEANMLYARLPRAAHQRLHQAGAHYYLEEGGLEGPEDEMLRARLVCDWSCTEAQIDTFLAHLARG